MTSQEIIVAIVAAIFASTGFWTFINNVYANKRERESVERKALKGLLHNELMKKCDEFVKQGFINVQDYEDLNEYIYLPYRDLGGNGTGERAWQELNKLPLERRCKKIEVEVDRRQPQNSK